MIGHFQMLARKAIVADPMQGLSTCPMLTEAEEHQLLVEWNDSTTDYPRTSASMNCLRLRVEENPGRHCPGLRRPAAHLSRTEYPRQTDSLGYLRKLGVGPKCWSASAWNAPSTWSLGLLGILKAGGAYVPLDPSYPKERLAFMLEDTEGSSAVNPRTADREVSPSQRDDSMFGSRLGRNSGREPRQPGAVNHGGQSSLCYLHFGVDGDPQKGH